jgi:hypothetical protein
MNPNEDLLVMFLMLGIYAYTLIHAHIIMAGIDKRIHIPRHNCGEIKRRSLLALARINFSDPDIRKVLRLLTFNQATVYIFFGFLVYDLVSRFSVIF